MFETDMTMGDIFWNIFFFICGITATLGANVSTVIIFQTYYGYSVYNEYGQSSSKKNVR